MGTTATKSAPKLAGYFEQMKECFAGIDVAYGEGEKEMNYFCYNDGLAFIEGYIYASGESVEDGDGYHLPRTTVIYSTEEKVEIETATYCNCEYSEEEKRELESLLQAWVDGPGCHF